MQCNFNILQSNHSSRVLEAFQFQLSCPLGLPFSPRSIFYSFFPPLFPLPFANSLRIPSFMKSCSLRLVPTLPTWYCPVRYLAYSSDITSGPFKQNLLLSGSGFRIHAYRQSCGRFWRELTGSRGPFNQPTYHMSTEHRATFSLLSATAALPRPKHLFAHALPCSPMLSYLS
ncbi:hypothetical protein K445DRAFT_214863 [Daldinia sp. EC12]|nr:hypothetical protein K445DRAFT_214863 [Daldinia sp. EC12]